VYNRARWLPRTIQSCLRQTYRDLEVIVVDDGSSDDSASQAERVAGLDPRVRVIRAPHGGQCAARNRGCAASKGDWLKFFDSDDLLVPWAIEHQLGLALAHRADVVCGNIELFWGDEDPPSWESVTKNPASIATYSEFVTFCERYHPTFNEILARKSLVNEVGGFAEFLGIAEEINLFLRMSLRFPSLRIIHDSANKILFKRCDPSSLAAHMRRDPGCSWILLSLEDVAKKMLGAAPEPSPEFREYVFRRLYQAIVTAWRDGYRDDARAALETWCRAGLRPPRLQPWYHHVLHQAFGFAAAEDVLGRLRRFRDGFQQGKSS